MAKPTVSQYVVVLAGKIESGKFHLEKQPFNLGELVGSLIWAFKDTIDSKGLNFSLSVDKSSKEFLSAHELLGDKHRVHQVTRSLSSINFCPSISEGIKMKFCRSAAYFIIINSHTSEVKVPLTSESCHLQS